MKLKFSTMHVVIFLRHRRPFQNLIVIGIYDLHPASVFEFLQMPGFFFLHCVQPKKYIVFPWGGLSRALCISFVVLEQFVDLRLWEEDSIY